MSHRQPSLEFDSPELAHALQDQSTEQLDELPFGVMGFDQDGRIVQYNAYEMRAAHFKREDVVGQHLFIELAPCFNNYMVAGRFNEAAEQGEVLDESLPYVLTFRMRPTRVSLRLLAVPGLTLRYVLVNRG